MELVVKLDMTDVELKYYMKKTTEDIIYTEDFKKALSDTLKRSFAEEIAKQSNNFINRSLYGSYYNKSDEIAISEQLAKEALSEYANSIKSIFAEYAKGLMASTDLDAIIRSILMDVMFSGIQEGMKEFYKESREADMINTGKIDELRCKLGL